MLKQDVAIFHVLKVTFELLSWTLKGIQVVCDSITVKFFVHQALGSNILAFFFCLINYIGAKH